MRKTRLPGPEGGEPSRSVLTTATTGFPTTTGQCWEKMAIHFFVVRNQNCYSLSLVHRRPGEWLPFLLQNPAMVAVERLQGFTTAFDPAWRNT